MEDLHRANLDKLADYLLTLPADYDKFNMAVFYEDKNNFCLNPIDLDVELHTCGTSACAIGHGPAAGIFPRCAPSREALQSVYTGWREYTRECFGAAPYSRRFELLFSEDWQPIDNTPYGAARRIKYYLDPASEEARTQAVFRPQEEFQKAADSWFAAQVTGATND